LNYGCENEAMKQNIVKDKSYQFAVNVVKFCRRRDSYAIRPLMTQLLKSATSIAANVEEAIAAQSRSDFISKMSIASKEAREAGFWLRLMRDAECFDASSLAHMLDEALQISRLLTAIVKTTREKTPEAPAVNSKFKIQNSKLQARS
jgi:four helix bundle protein